MRIPPRWLPAVRLLLIAAIFTSAGPELLPAIELATVLEMLGAALFLTAFGTALKMSAIDAARWLRDLLVPPALAVLYRHGGGPSKGSVVAYLSGRAVFLLMHAVVVVLFGIHVGQGGLA